MSDDLPYVNLNIPKGNTSFKDGLGITHEALRSALGDISLCGRLRGPLIFENKTLKYIRVQAQPRPPADVDCMACLVGRTRLDHMVEETYHHQPVGTLIELELRITSWG